MPGAAAMGRLAPTPISAEARQLLAAVAVTKLRLTCSCACDRCSSPPPARQALRLATEAYPGWMHIRNNGVWCSQGTCAQKCLVQLAGADLSAQVTQNSIAGLQHHPGLVGLLYVANSQSLLLALPRSG